jgi:HK97 family phage portal protein
MPFFSFFQKRIETKASAVRGLVSLHNTGQPVWTPRNYAAMAREGYARNAIVFRCVRLIAESVAATPLTLFHDDKELSDHPFTQLLERPNPRQGRASFLETVAGHLLVSGNAYIEAASIDDQVRELYALRPDRMKVLAGSDGWPGGYEYTVGTAKHRFDQSAEPVSPILHIALFHPLNDHYGMAPLEAAAVALDTHNAAAAWNKALLDNAARPSGALVYSGPDGATLTEDQFTRLKSELETQFQGTANAGRPMLLDGGLDWKAMALSPRDMDFAETRNAAAREIALAFGVPPMLLGIPGDNTYANYAEANKAFWRQTVLPLTERISGDLLHWLEPALGERHLRVETDRDRVDALSDERSQLWQRVSAADFLTDDEKRQAVGYGVG